MRTALTAFSTILAIGVATNAAVAAPNCTSEARANWLTEEAMRAKVVEMGYNEIRNFKVSGNCYEIYGRTREGKRAEVYFNPVSGAVVESKIGD